MSTNPGSRIPMIVKIAFTAFMAILVPVYWKNYGPTNFLYFCDVALFMTLIAVWTEKPIWASMPAVGILVPQFVWCLDFVGSAVAMPLTGMTAYMFDSKIELFARGLSFFHFWLPFLLVYLVYKLGYDRKAFLYWTICAWLLILVCYFFMPAPPAPPGSTLPVNINYVYGIGDAAKQTWMPELAWVGFLMVALPALFYVPAHFLLAKFFERKQPSFSVNISRAF
jgi:hypothetical protein